MDIKRIKQLAGLAPIVEAWEDGDFDRFMNGDGGDDEDFSGSGRGSFDDEFADDEDELSGSEQALVGQAERDLSAKGIRVKDADPEADMAALARTRAPEVDDDVSMDVGGEEETDDLPRGPDPEMGELEDTEGNDVLNGGDPEIGELESPAEKFPSAEEVDTPAEVKQAATKAASRSGVTQLASRMLTNNPNASRSEFFAVTRPLGISDHSANTMFYKVRNAMRAAPGTAPAADMPMELWVVKNASGKVLTESGTYDLPLWADYLDTKFEARIFDKEIHAKKAVESLAKYGFKKIEIAKETF